MIIKFYKIRIRDKWDCLFTAIRWMVFYILGSPIRFEDGTKSKGKLPTLTELFQDGLQWYRFRRDCIQMWYDKWNAEVLK